MDLSSLAKLILHPECQSIGFLTGAGVSVASGIPDFRSPGGMYATLRPELLTATPLQKQYMQEDPTHVVSWDLFQSNQFPYMEVRRPFILGTQNATWKATIFHRLVELLHVKTKKLTRLYTQNIDGLDRQCTHIPSDKIVNVHGSIGQASCEGCGAVMDFDDFCDQVRSNIQDIYNIDSDDDATAAPLKSTPISCPQCHQALVKPTTVLFGRSLPTEFFEYSEQDLPKLDILIVAGTSLVVSPANSLVYRVPETTKRILINRDLVGGELGLGDGRRDWFAPGDCESTCLELIDKLGWLHDLQAKKDLLPFTSQQLLEDYCAAKPSET